MLVAQLTYESNSGDLLFGLPRVGKLHRSWAIILTRAQGKSGTRGVEQLRFFATVSCVQKDQCIWCPTDNIESNRCREQFRTWNAQTILMYHLHLVIIQRRRLSRSERQERTS